MVQFRLLGSLEVAEDGRRAELGPPKQRALLAILLLRAGEIVPVDQIVELLWPDGPPREAEHAIQVYVSRLRAAMLALDGKRHIAWRSPGYVLDAAPESIDATLFEQLIGAGTRLVAAGGPQQAAALLGRALDLWRGEPLAEFVYEEFAQPAIRRLSTLRLDAFEALAAAEESLDHHDRVVQLADAAIQDDPFRERPRELKMVALLRSGRASEALREYGDYASLLGSELGTAPSERFRRLHEALVLRDLNIGPGARPRVGRAPGVRNPYKGLRAFEEADAVDYFGRDALIAELLAAVAAGRRLIALVGPSGCGKSSAVAAGLLPALRSGAVAGSEGWMLDRVVLGDRPISTIRASLHSRTARSRLLVIDQFEALFGEEDREAVDNLLSDLARLATSRRSRLRLLVALRADRYDCPLRHPEFAPAFSAGLVNLLPMTASELEAAVVEPAASTGMRVEPALLAELVSASIHRPGALPLLQHLLAELVDHRVTDELTLASYRSLGGLDASLSKRADEVYRALDSDRQVLARQLFLRLVRQDEDGPTLRRTPLEELTQLDPDPIRVADVLAGFHVSRLITYDRDRLTGRAVVQIAHDALLSGWNRLSTWIAEHHSDLEQQRALAARAQQWVEGGRVEDDLLTGGRLHNLEAWRRQGQLRLTTNETTFLDASIERRRVQEAQRAALHEQERRLRGRARRSIIAVLGAVVVVTLMAAYVLLAWPGTPPDVVLVYAGPDAGEAEQLGAAFDAVVADLDLDAQKVVETRDSLLAGLRRLSEQGVKLIVVGFDTPDVGAVAPDFPETHYIALGYHTPLPNVSVPATAREEGGFMVGVAAALSSGTGSIGFIGGWNDPVFRPYEAGFRAAAAMVRPGTDVDVEYILDRPVGPVGFSQVVRAARQMYREGADVLFVVAGSASVGALEAAHQESEAAGRVLWVVIQGPDMYAALPIVARREGYDASAWRPHVLTSLVVNEDLAAATMLREWAAGALGPGERRFGWADGAFELPASGGEIDDIQATLNAMADRIASGDIEVPRFPPDTWPPPG